MSAHTVNPNTILAGEVVDEDVLYVAADIHGSFEALHTLFERFSRESSARLLIAGDLALSRSERLAALAAGHRNRISAVRGNADSAWEQEMYGILLPLVRKIDWQNHRIVMYHGHSPFGMSAASQLPPGGIVITGHTHCHSLEFDHLRQILLLNPGSLSQPRSGSSAAYAVIRWDVCELLSVSCGKVIQKIRLPW